MRKDSGLMIVGVLFLALGGAVVNEGLDGKGIKPPSGGRGSIHASPEQAVNIGVVMLALGTLLIWQPRFFRSRK